MGFWVGFFLGFLGFFLGFLGFLGVFKGKIRVNLIGLIGVKLG